jgi:hemerythrin
MIKWQADYSVGIYMLDEQHKELFSFCNDIEEILRDGGYSKEFLGQGIKFLEKYVVKHFGQEETCMHQYACPVAKKNKTAHQKFIQAYKTFEKQINDGNDPYRTLKRFHRFLETWLVEHICKIDTQLKPCTYI